MAEVEDEESMLVSVVVLHCSQFLFVLRHVHLNVYNKATHHRVACLACLECQAAVVLSKF